MSRITEHNIELDILKMYIVFVFPLMMPSFWGEFWDFCSKTRE